MAKYTIVGFDPASTRNIGWASLVLSKKPSDTAKIANWEGGTFVMPVTEERWQVLWPMFMTVEAFLQERSPSLIVVEKTSSFAGGFVTGQVSQCMGAILAACGKLGIPVEFVYPTSVKKLVAGHGKASKSKLKKAVRCHLEGFGIKKPKFDSDHTADATASIFCWLMKNGVMSPLEED
jgi:Holliday junction resolvasome RuvABC endonuclease subunit